MLSRKEEVAKEQSDAALQSLREQNLAAIHQLETLPNPFVYYRKFTFADNLRDFMFGIVLVPIRLTIIVFCLVLLGLCSKAAISFGYDPMQPMTWWRRLILTPRPFLTRVLLFCFGVWYIEKKGELANIQDAPFVVVSPHSTFMDQFVVPYMCNFPMGVAKAEILEVPFFSSIMAAGQTIFVDRKDKNAKQKVLKEFERRANDPAWTRIALFPEGTCTNRRALINFRPGAFTPGVPVQPMLLRWSTEPFDPTWTSASPSRLMLILRLLCQPVVKCKVEFLKPCIPNKEERADPQLFTQNVRSLMASRLRIPTTEHSYEDAFLSLQARKERLDPAKTVTFEFRKLKLLQISYPEAQSLLHRFAKAKGAKKVGLMSVTEFADVLGVPLTDEVAELFGILDTDGVGSIDFRSFMVGLAFLSNKTSLEESVRVFFNIFADSSGKISVEDVKHASSKMFRKVENKAVDSFFKSVDPKGTGFVDFDNMLHFMNKHPEYLHLGIEMSTRYKLKGKEVLPELTKEQAESVAKQASGKNRPVRHRRKPQQYVAEAARANGNEDCFSAKKAPQRKSR
mmetsp:Transcript_9942/g.12883  ORF Transcript_9942/g.12883 Transcript_9942/m.12883 type:complete len:567 (+) Transcript_9942:116-1816(+)